MVFISMQKSFWSFYPINRVTQLVHYILKKVEEWIQYNHPYIIEP